ncbi:thiamine phosphate synthase [Pendulispora rubella]|uniref:Thiamine-phosphate synthase n=1 Tax=Pendulispora rubella TaxID=2741070 RepID=A0ABZ2LFE9_9BACT
MMRGLYGMLDLGTLEAQGIAPVDFAKQILTVRPAALQLRAKDFPPREMLALLRLLLPLCRRAGVPLVCNDRADVAVLAGCDMVHLGQDDAPIDFVRRISPGLRVGLSTHNLEQLARALESRPAYVAYGPVFPTSTKRNPDDVVGIEGLRAASALARSHGTPLVAIGGITLERAPLVAPWADSAAVIAGLFDAARTPREMAVAFHAALGGCEAEPAPARV